MTSTSWWCACDVTQQVRLATDNDITDCKSLMAAAAARWLQRRAGYSGESLKVE